MEITEFRAVAFDAVGTLMTPDPPAGEAYWQVGARHGSRRECSDVTQRFHGAFRETLRTSPGEPHRTSEHIERNFWRSVVSRVFQGLPPSAIDACFQELFDHFADPRSWRVYSDVAETLGVLRSRGVEVAVASNFDARLHAVFQGHAVLETVSQRFVSSELGWRKPDSRFFAAVCEKLGLNPGDVLYVGDDPRLDVEAARAAGLRAVLLERTESAGADAVTSLGQILPTERGIPTLADRSS